MRQPCRGYCTIMTISQCAWRLLILWEKIRFAPFKLPPRLCTHGINRPQADKHAGQEKAATVRVAAPFQSFCYCPDGPVAGVALASCFTGCAGMVKCSVMPQSANSSAVT